MTVSTTYRRDDGARFHVQTTGLRAGPYVVYRTDGSSVRWIGEYPTLRDAMRTMAFSGRGTLAPLPVFA